MNLKKVSVIIPSFGRPDYLTKSIKSVIDQDYAGIELIVVDDNGENTPLQLETQQIVESFQNKFDIKYIVHKVNKGAAAARNTGASVSTGEYIALLDNDDLSLPQRISRQVEILDKARTEDESVQACLCLGIRKKRGAEVSRSDLNYANNHLFELLSLKIVLLSGSALLISRFAFDELNGFDTRFKRDDDLEFMIRFYTKFKVIMLNEHLVVINIDDRSNIPGYEKIKQTKKLLFETFGPVIARFDLQQQKEIYKNTTVEIAKVALWNKRYRAFFKEIASAGLTMGEMFGLIKDISKKAFIYLVK